MSYKSKFGAVTFSGLDADDGSDYDESDKINNSVAKGRHPIVYSDNDIADPVEELSEPVVWIGREWAVTSYGIQRRDGRYSIPASDLWDENDGHGLPHQIAEKGSSWTDFNDFMTALLVARGYFGRK